MRVLIVFSLALVVGTPAVGTEPETKRSTAYEWLEVALEASAREVERHGPQPTVASRALAISTTAMFDAWAAYDRKAAGTRLAGTLRRPAAERTQDRKEKAIAHAAYRALLDLYPDDAKWLAEQMRGRGLDPQNNSIDVTTPEGIGNVVAQALVDARHRDGANQLGDERGSSGARYSDYTFYRSVNSEQAVLDPDRWQGGLFQTPHWYRVTPFALERSDQFRPPAPPHVGSETLRKDVEEVVAFNARLTPKQKAMVEFMRDGPRSLGEAAQWIAFAQFVSRRDGSNLDRDVKLFFAVANVAMDAFIAAWDSKRAYDSARPWTLVRHQYAGGELRAWAGPGKGVATLPAEKWQPYSPSASVSPSPAYVSSHSAVGSACARVLTLFTGSDVFGEVERRSAGAQTEPGASCQAMQAREGKGTDENVVCEIELPLPTFSAAAEMAGLSRVMAGEQVQTSNMAGLELGRKVANFDWPRIQSYFEGTGAAAKPRSSNRLASDR